MWCAPFAFVLPWETWGLEVGSVHRRVKLILDAEHVAPGIVKIEDVAADLFGYGDPRK